MHTTDSVQHTFLLFLSTLLRYEVSGPISADEKSEFVWKRHVKKK